MRIERARREAQRGHREQARRRRVGGDPTVRRSRARQVLQKVARRIESPSRIQAWPGNARERLSLPGAFRWRRRSAGGLERLLGKGLRDQRESLAEAQWLKGPPIR